VTPAEWAAKIIDALDAARAVSSRERPVHEHDLLEAAIEDILDEDRRERACQQCADKAKSP
jgi:hypothetical protein